MYESAVDARQIRERKCGDDEYDDDDDGDRKSEPEREKIKKPAATTMMTTRHNQNETRGEKKGNYLRRRSPPDSQHTTPTIRGKAISHNDVGDGRGGEESEANRKWQWVQSIEVPTKWRVAVGGLVGEGAECDKCGWCVQHLYLLKAMGTSRGIVFYLQAMGTRAAES